MKRKIHVRVYLSNVCTSQFDLYTSTVRYVDLDVIWVQGGQGFGYRGFGQGFGHARNARHET